MAVPGSGELSLGKIRQELQTNNYAGGVYTAAATGLDPAENGTYATINTCSPLYPLSANPANMSEWYGYDHDALCPASLYALDDGGDPSQQNMLYDGGTYYDTVVSTSYPNALGTWSLNVWVKVYSSSPTQGYWFGLRDTFGGGDQLVIYHGGADIICSIVDGSNGGAFVEAVLNDTGNTSITGVGSGKTWNNSGPSNQGDTNSNGYTMITVVYDYAQYGNDSYFKMFWNGEQLSTPWTASPSSGVSQCTGDVGTDNKWDDTECMVGGFVPSELSSGLYIDELSFFYDKALSDAEVTQLWNGGTVIPYNDITGSNGANTTALLHYSFEDGGTLGKDSGPNGYNLQDFNGPVQTSDHA
tara:strand:+ start:422 stop:1492 length:1071 start_codon:yes stop_codon:yes gene_type:complete